MSNLYFTSQMLYRKFRGNWFVGLLGTWQDVGENGMNNSIPVSGLAYWISPPRDLMAFITEPLHSLVYTVFVMICCAFFSRYSSAYA